ncbi:hypothetical protein [Cupriavidus metallidurans]|uniref:hypothetical protein n=1 Tax=Cupriavidus metallidurans TaxID=119219 RepID=UPI000560A75F|nr:hypothetical protein [Cupriavidus metallidurans]
MLIAVWLLVCLQMCVQMCARMRTPMGASGVAIILPAQGRRCAASFSWLFKHVNGFDGLVGVLV